MKKSLAIGIAGIAAAVVATWRRVQRDNTLASDSAGGTESVPAAPASRSGGSTATNRADTTRAASPSALFTPSVSEKSTKAELYEIATELGIDGRSKMNKGELLAAIRSAT